MFLAWVTQGFAPALRPGDVVILDNLAAHQIRGVREAIEVAGARLMRLPPYSPDFNPIEPMWSKIKRILLSQAPRTNEQLLLAAKTVFNSISAADCINIVDRKVDNPDRQTPSPATRGNLVPCV